MRYSRQPDSPRPPDKETITLTERHRRRGIGAFLRIVTQARQGRPPSRASNAARPTVTVRPSRHGAARRVHGRDQVAFRDQVCLDEGLDVAHARTTALRAGKVKEKPRLQSE